MEKYHTIVTHVNPHLDEITAIWLLRRFGEKKFLGISTAKITFWSTGGQAPDGRSAEDYEREGILLIGIGGGCFDEHPANGSARKKGECAATLVAKALGVDNDPALEKILKFAVNSDLKGTSHLFDLASIVKVLHQEYPDNPEKVMEWATIGLEAKYQEQLQFFNAAIELAKADFEKDANIENILGPHGRTLKMATIISDNPQMSKFARSDYGGNADIVIQQRSSGNVQIFTNRFSGLVLYDVVQMIRLAEQEVKGKIVTTDWKELASEGKVEGVEEWYFQKAGQMLLNGSLTATQVPSTRLSLEKIKEIVRIGVNPMAFQPERAPGCQQGVCSSTLRQPCPWYQFGLHRCREIRFKTRGS